MYYYANQEYFHQLEERLQQLEQENENLKQKVDQIKPVNIENMNYKIQELVVRELKGTLNIGMTGLSDPKEVQKWLQQSEDGEDITLHDMDQAPEESNANQKPPFEQNMNPDDSQS